MTALPAPAAILFDWDNTLVEQLAVHRPGAECLRELAFGHLGA